MFTVVICGNVRPAAAGTSAPKIVVAEYRHDFGDIFAGQFMDHAFTIRNEGDAPLSLSDEVRHAPIAAWNKMSSPAAPADLLNDLASGSSGLLSKAGGLGISAPITAKNWAHGFVPHNTATTGLGAAFAGGPAPT